MGGRERGMKEEQVPGTGMGRAVGAGGEVCAGRTASSPQPRGGHWVKAPLEGGSWEKVLNKDLSFNGEVCSFLMRLLEVNINKMLTVVGIMVIFVFF